MKITLEDFNASDRAALSAAQKAEGMNETEMRSHQNVCEQIRRVIREVEDRGMYDIPAGLIALKVCNFYVKDSDPHPEVRWAAFEQCKTMARKILAEQAERLLQDCYPIKTKGDSVEKPLEALTEEEVLWNFDQLHKGGAFQHAAALLAYHRQQCPEADDDEQDDEA